MVAPVPPPDGAPPFHRWLIQPVRRFRTARAACCCGNGERAGQGQIPPPEQERGSAAVEFIGFVPLLLLVALVAVQLGLAAFAAQQAGTGARAAARTATLDEPRTTPADAAREAMTGWVADRADTTDAPSCAGRDEVTATVGVSVPGLVPGTDFHVTRHATMRCPAPAPAPATAPVPAPGGAR
ncbi:TadE/TadG family type IV pilus assembly protein [Streptomyces luteireticuli]|uniref:TadE/TadG family type IV pilus assembly protein n=1 Tax=Streptomyces luteireticuli TaxID=173858 RepID=UPI003556AFEC